MAETDRYNLEAMDTKVQTFKIDVNFPSVDPPNQVTEIIAKVSASNQIRNLTGLELLEYSTILSAYSLYLSIQENKLDGLIGWCESNIKFIVGRNVREANAYSFNEKDSYIRANEPNAVDLHDKKLEYQAKKDSIKFISHKIHNLAEHLRSLGNEKIKERTYSRN